MLPLISRASHNGMARPQAADGGTASSMRGSCEYIEYAVVDSQQGVVLQLGGWARCLQLLTVKTYLVTKYFMIMITCIIIYYFK